MNEEDANSIAGYVIVETINDSSTGVIYRAVRQSSGEKVWIKKYYPSLLWSESNLNEFYNLIGYLRFIEHEYLLPILDFGKQDGKPYVVFEDDSLTLLVSRQAAQSSQLETLDFLSKIAETLDYLHKQEILHGTLNIENVALDAQGDLRLYDFGLSGILKKVLLENMEDGFDNLSISNLYCTSPEQIQGLNPTRASDIYAFGIIAYYYVFGELPFHEQHTVETALKHLTHGVVRRVNPPQGISKNTLRFIQKCLQVHPDARFPNFRQILKVLDRMKRDKAVRFVFEKRFASVHSMRRLRVAQWSFGGLILLLGLAVSVYFLAPQKTMPMAEVNVILPSVLPASEQPTVPPRETMVVGLSTNSDMPSEKTPTEPPLAETVPKPSIENEPPPPSAQVISAANLSDLREIFRLGYGKPEDVDVSLDGTNIAVATSAGVYIFAGNRLSTWIDPQDWATSVRFSPDGNLLAIGLDSGDIQLWDWHAGIKTAMFSGHTQRVNRIIFSKDRLYSTSDDQNIIVWNLKTYKSVQVISAHSKPVNDMAVTSDDRILVSCSDDRRIRVWDVASGKKLYELCFDPNCSAVNAVAISSDDAFFAAGGESGFIRQWSLVTSGTVNNLIPLPRTDSIPVGKRIWTLQYIRDNEELLAGVDDGEPITYNAARMEYEGISLDFEIPSPPKDLVDVFGPNFKFDSASTYNEGNTISINWDGKVTYQQTQIVSPMYDILDRLDLSQDGSILAAGGRHGSTNVWNLTTGVPIYKNLYFLPFGDPISPDGSSIAIIVPKTATTTSFGTPIIEDYYQMKGLTGAQTTRDFSEVVKDGLVSYAHDGQVFIAGSLNDSNTWDFVSGYETYSSGYLFNSGCRVTVSENDNEKLQINSVAGVIEDRDGQYINRLCPLISQHGGYLSAFSNDLTLLVYVSSNNKILEAYDGSKDSVAWRYPLQSPATVLAVSPDGSMVSFGNTSGMMTFLDGRSGEFLWETTGNFGVLYALEFSEDGRKVATAGQDGVARVFSILETK